MKEKRYTTYVKKLCIALIAMLTCGGYQAAAAAGDGVVTPQVFDDITVTPNPIVLNVGETRQLTVMAHDDDKNRWINCTTNTTRCTYKSSNTSVATVSSTGLVTGIKNGTATITVAGDVNAVKTVPVTVGPDTQPPAPPGYITINNRTDTSVTISWVASTDNIGVTGYYIYNGSTQIGSTASTSYTINGLTPSTTYTFTIKATDAAGNISTGSSKTITTDPPNDQTPPSAPVLSVKGKSDQTASLTWSAATDNVGVTNYRTYRDSTRITTLPPENLSYTATGLAPNTTYTFSVHALDAAGNATPSNSVTVTTYPSGISLFTGSSFIVEDSNNDGTISATQVITLVGSTFASDMSTGVTVNNLPAGLGIWVVRNSDTQITVSFLGKAINHANSDDISNASVTVSQSKIAGATADIRSGLFRFDFRDPEPVITLTRTVVSESAENDGRIVATQEVNLSYGMFTADAAAYVKVNRLPAGLGISAIRNSDTKLTIAFTGKAINHANANDEFNATVTIPQAKVTGATVDVTSGPFKFDFFDEFSGGLTYQYDARNRLIAILLNGTVKVEFTYDENGNLATQISY